MKVLLINGSSNKKGSTYSALNEFATTLEKEGIETEIIKYRQYRTKRLLWLPHLQD